MGLVHVEDLSDKEIMISSLKNIDGDFRSKTLSVVDSGPFTGWRQNSNCSIRGSLALKWASDCPLTIPNSWLFSLGLSSADIYDLGIGLNFSDDAFASFLELGDFFVDKPLEFEIPIGVSSFYLLGKSVEGGEFDIFGSPLDFVNLDDVLYENFLFDPALTAGNINFFQKIDDRTEKIGVARFNLKTVPAPPSLALILLGGGVFCFVRRRKTAIKEK